MSRRGVVCSLYLRGATEGGGGAVVLQTFFAESKVCEDDMTRGVQQYVLWLQVPVVERQKDYYIIFFLILFNYIL